MAQLGAVLSGLVVLVAGCTGGSGDAGSPGCTGSPDAGCSSEGEICPGSLCVQCGLGVYTFSSSNCTCTSGRWDCSAPAAGQVVCPSTQVKYVDPACTVPYGPDASRVGPDAAVEVGSE
jgi:hypothetical protein